MILWRQQLLDDSLNETYIVQRGFSNLKVRIINHFVNSEIKLVVCFFFSRLSAASMQTLGVAKYYTEYLRDVTVL